MELPPEVIEAIRKYGDLLINGTPEETTEEGEDDVGVEVVQDERGRV